MKTIDLLWFLTVVELIYCEEGVVRRVVMNGSDVVLPCSLDNKDIGPALFDWMKDGRQEVFLYDAGTHYNNGRQGQDEQFKGRVSHFPDKLRNGNASIIIRNTRQSDSGSYTCYFPHIQQQRFLIELLVGVVKRMVMAGSDVVLPCSLNNKNIELALFDWMKDDRQEVFLYNAGTHSNSGHPGQDEQFKGRVSHFPDELINGNASIIIRNTRLSDSGSYTCYFPHIQQQRFHIELLVGVSPKPRVMILSITPDWALLQCEVRRAFPKTQIVWHDSDGIILPAEEKLEDSDDPHCPPALTLQTNVTKTSNFCCVVTQQEPHHMTEGHIHVHICRDSMKTKCVGVIAGAGVCDLVVFSTVLATFLICWKIGWFRYIRRTMRERRERDRHSDLENDPAERHTCDKLCHIDGCPAQRHTCDIHCHMDGCPVRRDRDRQSDLENDQERRERDRHSDLENDPERRDSGTDSDLENDPEQPLNTEEDTEPGVATVEPDGTVRYTCKNRQNSSHGLY